MALYVSLDKLNKNFLSHLFLLLLDSLIAELFLLHPALGQRNFFQCWLLSRRTLNVTFIIIKEKVRIG